MSVLFPSPLPPPLSLSLSVWSIFFSLTLKRRLSYVKSVYSFHKYLLQHRSRWSTELQVNRASDLSCSWDIAHSRIILISPGCPWLRIALQCGIVRLKYHSLTYSVPIFWYSYWTGVLALLQPLLFTFAIHNMHIRTTKFCLDSIRVKIMSQSNLSPSASFAL